MARLSSMDYYKILEVDQDVTAEDIKMAYKQLAIKWHPDKNLKNHEECEEKFKQINEAYKVLSDPQKRAEYVFNETSPSSSQFSYHSFSDSLFDSPFSQGSSSTFSDAFSDSLFRSIFGRGFTPKVKDPPIEHNVNCTLEDLYFGAVKRFVISREVLGPRGTTKEVKETVTINIQPGMQNGTRFVVEEKGSEKPNTIPADIILILNQKPHDLFTREGDDLIFSETASLFECFVCYREIDFRTLDGKDLRVNINCFTFPRREWVFKGEGMPSVTHPSFRGDLKIHLNLRLL